MISSQTAVPVSMGIPLGLKVIFLGIALIFIGFITLTLASLTGITSAGGVNASGGAIVIIGPFPIAFGFGPHAPLMLTIGAIGAILLMLIAFLMMRRL